MKKFFYWLKKLEKVCTVDYNNFLKCIRNFIYKQIVSENIKIKFYELDDRDNIIWEANGRFSELDVHHQYAIVFKYVKTKIFYVFYFYYTLYLKCVSNLKLN
jgi:hypothetical protein